MNKYGASITLALLILGVAAAAMAADSPGATTTMVVDTPAAGANPAPPIGPKEDQRAIDTSPPNGAGKPTSSTLGHKKSAKHATTAKSPKAAATMAVDTAAGANPAPPIGPKEDQRAIDTAPPKNAGKPTNSALGHKKSHKPATPAATTTQ